MIDEEEAADPLPIESASSEEDETNKETIDDPILRTIEVYVNRVLNNSNGTAVSDMAADAPETTSPASLFLMQYPLRPIYRPYGDQGRLVGARYRTQQQALQLRYALNMEGENFDKLRREEFLNAQFSGSAKDCMHVLESTTSTSPHSSYGLGLLVDDRMYITPLTAVLQFRPDLTHIDEKARELRRSAENQMAARAAMRQKPDSNRDESNVPDEGGESNSTAPAERARPTSMTIPPELEWHRYPPHRVREWLMQEPWKEVESIYDADSVESYEIIRLLSSFDVKVPPDGTTTTVGSDPALLMMAEAQAAADADGDATATQRVSGGPLVPKLQFAEDVAGYERRLCCVVGPEDTSNAEPASGPLSFLSLNRLPIDQQVLRIMRHRHVESFPKIKKLVTHKVPEEELIRHLKHYADLIQGNWVCRSAHVCEGVLTLCRDLLLCVLTKGTPVLREKLRKFLTCLSGDKVTSLLKDLCVCRDGQWVMKIEPDKAFAAEYATLAEEAKKKYSEQEAAGILKKIAAMTASLKGGTQGAEGNGVLDSTMISAVAAAVLRQTGASPVSNLMPAIRKGLSDKSVDFDVGVRAKIQNAVAELTETEVLAVLPAIGEEIGMEHWVLRKMGDAQIDRHRDVILSLFRDQALQAVKSNKLSSIKGYTKQGIINAFQGRNVSFGLPDFQFRELMKEFAINKAGFWIFRGIIRAQAAAAEASAAT